SSRWVGLDHSESFLQQARQRGTERVSFCLHDFTVTPFPVGPADLLFARFELTHVVEAPAVVAGWGTQLRPGGALWLEETEWIETSVPGFSLYLSIVERLLAAQGHVLYVGRVLEAAGEIKGLERRSSQVFRLPVGTAAAAELFHMNIQTWKTHPFIR